jgi:hypothetical protein
MAGTFTPYKPPGQRPPDGTRSHHSQSDHCADAQPRKAAPAGRGRPGSAPGKPIDRITDIRNLIGQQALKRRLQQQLSLGNSHTARAAALVSPSIVRRPAIEYMA